MSGRSHYENLSGGPEPTNGEIIMASLQICRE